MVPNLRVTNHWHLLDWAQYSFNFININSTPWPMPTRFSNPDKTNLFRWRVLPCVFGFLAPVLAHIDPMLSVVDWDRTYPVPFAITMRIRRVSIVLLQWYLSSHHALRVFQTWNAADSKLGFNKSRGCFTVKFYHNTSHLTFGWMNFCWLERERGRVIKLRNISLNSVSHGVNHRVTANATCDCAAIEFGTSWQHK